MEVGSRAAEQPGYQKTTDRLFHQRRGCPPAQKTPKRAVGGWKHGGGGAVLRLKIAGQWDPRIVQPVVAIWSPTRWNAIDWPARNLATEARTNWLEGGHVCMYVSSSDAYEYGIRSTRRLAGLACLGSQPCVCEPRAWFSVSLSFLEDARVLAGGTMVWRGIRVFDFQGPFALVVW